jgi:phosphohistidine swiveling domain-containing protein
MRLRSIEPRPPSAALPPGGEPRSSIEPRPPSAALPPGGEPRSSIRALADADASCGAKAAALARLIAAGLPVPDGFVIDRAGFRDVAALAEAPPDDDAIGHALADAGQRIADAALPGDVDREVRERARALGRLAVRSSASIEDGELGAAAGVFASVTDVAPDDVWDAIRAVWTSALTPLAVAYARRRTAAVDPPGGARGTDGEPGRLPRRSAWPIDMSVFVQRFVPGARQTVYTRAPGSPGGDELWLSSDDAPVVRVARAAAAGTRAAELALAAEAAIGAGRGADVELVHEPGGARTWIVQARPIVHPVRRERPAPPPILLAPLVQDGRRWTWDITHNPDPLSPAQAGLVELVDRAGCVPYAMRVCAGYLYTAARDDVGVPPQPPTDRAGFDAQVAAICARFVLGEPASLAEALERYVSFMAIWAGELSPLVAAARRRLPDQLARDGHPPQRIPGMVAAIVGRRPGVRDGVMSPAWDVAVPTFSEQGIEPRPSAELPAELAGNATEAAIELARAAADAAEADDLWFARAQWMVRRTLLAHGAAFELRDDDVFWLPLAELVTLRSSDPGLHRRASAARAAHARAADWDMPLTVHGAASTITAPEASETLRGVGFGPKVIGRVVRLASLTTAGRIRVHRGDVVVARAITPALAMLVEGCAALVSETGGLLDHGASLARELGVTCVVGCTGAWTQLTDGALISVDGNAGVVGLAPQAITTRATTAT